MSKSFELINDVGLEDGPIVDPKSMTDEDIAKLRFTWLSLEEQESVQKELEKRSKTKQRK